MRRARSFCPGPARQRRARAHAHPQSAPEQGSTRACWEGRGRRHARARGPSQPCTPPAEQAASPAGQGASGTRRDARLVSRATARPELPRQPRTHATAGAPGSYSRRTPCPSNPARACADTHDQEPNWDHEGAGGTIHRVVGPTRVPTTPRSVPPPTPRPPIHARAVCTHTNSWAGEATPRSSGRDTQAAASHPSPLHAAPPPGSHLPPSLNPENSTKPKSQRRPPIVF